MRPLLPLALLLLTACDTPVAKPEPAPASRKVVYQPPPNPVPRPVDGQPGSYPTVVELGIDGAGRVTQVLPKSGVDPFLSATISYAKQYRFTPNFPTTPNSLVRLAVTYTWGPAKTVDISLRP